MASVAVGWGQYLNELLRLAFGFAIPDALSQPPGSGGIVNVPAIVVVLLAMVLLLSGAKESARANTVMVAVKIAHAGAVLRDRVHRGAGRNFTPFLPLGRPG